MKMNTVTALCAAFALGCFGSDGGSHAGSGGASTAGSGAGASAGASAGTRPATGGTGAGASGASATGGTSGSGGAAGTLTSSYDCNDCTLVCSLGPSSPCQERYAGECACAVTEDAGTGDPMQLLECLNTYFDTDALCTDACEPCCQGAGEDHGMCGLATPGPYRCTCFSDPEPRGCQATGCPDGEECCDPGVPCSPSCAPIGKCPACPYDCDSPDTPVATPGGERPIAELREGDLVLSVDHGEVRAVPIVATRQHAVSDHHAVVRVVLASGRVIEISASHPTTDGRSLGALAPGDLLGDVLVESVSMIQYTHAFTYDILPASDTGSYFAAGALIGSTLAVSRFGGEP